MPVGIAEPARVGTNQQSLLVVKSNQQLMDEEKAEAEALRLASQPPIEGLAAYVRRCFEDAHSFRSSQGITQRILACLRQRKGEYDPTVAQLIADQGGGCTTFFNITEVKANAAASWIRDIIAQSGEKAWELAPTPVPTLPVQKQEEAVQKAAAMAAGYRDETGMVPSAQAVVQFALDTYDELQQEAFDTAKEITDRMEKKMHDQCIEGGFFEALYECIDNLVTFPITVLKGPIVRSRKQAGWDPVDSSFIVSDNMIPTWYAVRPFDFYPAPSSRSVQDSYVCEVVNVDVRDLESLMDADGWSAGGIAGVLAAYGAGHLSINEQDITGQATMADLENRNLTEDRSKSSTILRGIEFWGPVQGMHLLEMYEYKRDKLPEDFSPLRFYEACVMLIGPYTVKAVLNPDPLGRRPYAVATYRRVPGSIWGRGLPELMSDCQEPYNACLRNLIDNLALCSGPQGMVDLSAIAPGQNYSRLAPRKIWQYYGEDSNNSKPIEFFTVDCMSDELLKDAEYFSAQADDRTQVPRFAHGNEDIGGAGQTASGLSMLMNAASKGMKFLIANLDSDIMRPTLEMLYHWNMQFLDEPELKGDAQVVPRGAMAALVREQIQLRRLELLNITNNDVDLTLMGYEGRAELLRAVFQEAHIPVEKLVLDNEQIRQRTGQAAENELAAIAQPGGEQPPSAAPSGAAPPAPIAQGQVGLPVPSKAPSGVPG